MILIGCGDDPVSSNKPEVVSELDNFHFRLVDAKNLDTSISYWWRFDGTSANIDQSSEIKGGTATVTVEDASNRQVYQTDLRTNGSFVTEFGAEGAFWIIRFIVRDFSGTIDFRARRR